MPLLKNISQLNKENKEKLDVMKENVGKLNIEAFVADKEAEGIQPYFFLLDSQ